MIGITTVTRTILFKLGEMREKIKKENAVKCVFK